MLNTFKYISVIFVIVLTTMPLVRATGIKPQDDPVITIVIPTITVFPNNRKGRVDTRKYERLVKAIRLTYPIAMEAQNRLGAMEKELLSLKTKKEQDEYIKNVEKELKNIYTPILKNMSLYQGIILLKLIDRQTGKTSFRLVQELRGKFSAFFWQGIAKLFGANLKTEYDAYGEDLLMEQLVLLYEKGQL